MNKYDKLIEDLTISMVRLYKVDPPIFVPDSDERYKDGYTRGIKTGMAIGGDAIYFLLKEFEANEH